MRMSRSVLSKGMSSWTTTRRLPDMAAVAAVAAEAAVLLEAVLAAVDALAALGSHSQAALNDALPPRGRGTNQPTKHHFVRTRNFGFDIGTISLKM